MNEYMKKTDFYGKIWIWTAVVVVLTVPVAICLYYDAWPSGAAVLKGLLGVAPIYWTVGVIEVITYTPMLGTGGTYLASVTGNLTSIKAPSALNTMENAEVKPGTEEGEIISTMAIASSSIVTTLVCGTLEGTVSIGAQQMLLGKNREDGTALLLKRKLK